MAIDSTITRTRRAILAGGLGGLTALVANALGRPDAVRAGVDGDVVLGEHNIAEITTSIQNTTTSSTVFEVVSDSARGIHVSSESGLGVFVSCFDGDGLVVESHFGTAVSGHADRGPGVFGHAGDLWGVFGSSHSIEEAAVFGGGYGSSTGVQGYSGPAAGAPPSPPKTGIHGYAAQDATARGVHGQTTIGRGVFGEATSGLGVRGFATTGIGVSAEATTGYALRTKGRIKLDQSAGQASIASGASSVVVTPGIDLTSSSAVIATLNGNAGGSTTVKRVAIDTAANTFTIYLTANSTATVKVAWLVAS